jgi:biopolymer transport protein ExbD
MRSIQDLIMAIPSSNDSGLFGEINITPLTDIFLVLLIIFMVGAAVAIESAAHVGLPQARAEAANQPPDNVIVELTGERRILVDNREIGLNDLEPVLHTAMQKSHDKIVIFKGDPKVILGDMVIVLDIAKRAGAQQLGVAISDTEAEGTAPAALPNLAPSFKAKPNTH